MWEVRSKSQTQYIEDIRFREKDGVKKCYMGGGGNGLERLSDQVHACVIEHDGS